jgi:hypothetical protein
VAASSHSDFQVAIYARAFEVAKMADLDWLSEQLGLLTQFIKVDKFYLETHRDRFVVDESTLVKARDFLHSRGIRVSGGIAVTADELDRYRTYCYSTPADREMLSDVVSLSARVFDQVVLDDFFFTNCRCALCIAAKGDRSWTEARLAQMELAAHELVLGPAREANPNVQVVIKYPNWYEHFQGLGFDLDVGPRIFDAIYAGNETRDPVVCLQHLQPYESYLVSRYFENIKPGGHLGGWVDPFGISNLDRYAEQIWLTLFARAPEITLFDIKALTGPVIEGGRGPWQGSGTSFDYDSALARYLGPDGRLAPEAVLAAVAGSALSSVEGLIGKLGNPIGVKAYRPARSSGEAFIHNYLGMIGLPIDLVPEFPADAPLIFLAESAASDPELIDKMKSYLLEGGSLLITTGLVRATQERGLRDIVEIACTDRRLVATDFLIGWDRTEWDAVYSAERPLVMPVIEYFTNDSWEEMSYIAGGVGAPFLHMARYGRGELYVLAVPESLDDLYHLPRPYRAM